MRILWLANREIAMSDRSGSGSWFDALGKSVAEANGSALTILTHGDVREVTHLETGGVRQWVIPRVREFQTNGLPYHQTLNVMRRLVDRERPELIHVWGTEWFGGLLVARGILPQPALLEMQGVKAEIAKVFYGGLTWCERLGCIGLKELMKCRTMAYERREYRRWGTLESEIIRAHKFVDVQTLWVALHVRSINPRARLICVQRALRPPFYDTVGWRHSREARIFCTAAYPSPFKGLHVAIRALALVRTRNPGVRMRIAGAHQRPGIRQEGYVRWLNRLIARMGLSHAIEWLGPLDAEQITRELELASAALIPSFIENCCNAAQEAMSVGTPLVASYAGGIPSLGKDEESCLFFAPGDEAMCAHQLCRILNDRLLAVRLSQNARAIAATRSRGSELLAEQLRIYDQVICGRQSCSREPVSGEIPIAVPSRY